ncbi:uncharacterized protein LOC112344168 [Selaginella moellendorffii]|uniref:uncharacterized protein LOC112344168 n=1 Tax=Selaginella moellendorffii TaxID=88036 RepID=UPI000D1C5A0F|nr:uncharacterized protein LOC112344168 [Selaginella moellendorffii]|eukprot:XP_024524221.1 uncharacterized protein LOC112344168 [Selaginella moellendorffii]
MRRMDWLLTPRRKSQFRRWGGPSPMLASELSMESMATSYEHLSSSQVSRMWREADTIEAPVSRFTRQRFFARLIEFCQSRGSSSRSSSGSGSFSSSSGDLSSVSPEESPSKRKKWWRMDTEKRWPVQGWC